MSVLFDLCGRKGEDIGIPRALEELKRNISLISNFDVNMVDDKHDSLLTTASMFGLLEIVKYLVETYPNINVDIQNQNGMTAMMWACFMGNLEVVKYLYSKFPHTIDIKSEGEKWSPLKCAYFDDHIEVVKYLIEECNVDVTKENRIVKIGDHEIIMNFIDLLFSSNGGDGSPKTLDYYLKNIYKEKCLPKRVVSNMKNFSPKIQEILQEFIDFNV